MNILFIASDNNASSGAFLSMVKLNSLLNQKLGVQTFVILPCKGDGNRLLDSLNISYKIIYSVSWCIPLYSKHPVLDIVKKIIKKSINFFALIGFVRFIKRNHFDIVHVNTSYSYIGAVAAGICHIPVVWHLREFLEEDKEKKIWNKKYGYKLIGRSEKIITVSKSLYNKYESIFPQSKLYVILNGIDTGRFYFPDREIFTGNKVVITIIGGIFPKKGQKELVEAVAKLDQSIVNRIEVWIIGRGEAENEKSLKLYIKQHNLENTVQMLGYKENVSEYLRRTDIVAMCSKAEAFGRVTVEAMLAGCLVIGANTAGTKELIQDQETGLLYHSGSAECLAKVISKALFQKEKMKAIAANGQKYMVENMTAEINAEKIFNLYQEVLNGKQ